jgi:large subunit ribosomal protein L21
MIRRKSVKYAATLRNFVPSKTIGAFMYAIFESGGKQHRVVEGETLKLEKIEVATGETIEFDKVYLVANGDDVKIGGPVVDGAKVTAEVVSHGRADKVKIIKFRRRKHSMKRQGHRQWFTEVKITGITG